MARRQQHEPDPDESKDVKRVDPLHDANIVDKSFGANEPKTLPTPPATRSRRLPVTSQQTHPEVPIDNTVKDPEDWKTGNEPMTGAQISYLNTLSYAAGLKPRTDLTKSEAAELINQLREELGVADDNGNAYMG